MTDTVGHTLVQNVFFLMKGCTHGIWDAVILLPAPDTDSHLEHVPEKAMFC